mmetsp:Transcript_3228/g.3765  ORF Transcript_3228/g.3765 Transcript_3228/m.3765 type:complete len:90 (+) Transcript_3228:2496-2765(+)
MATRNLKNDWNRATEDEQHINGIDSCDRLDNDSTIHYNFMERKDHSSMYNSMQKTLKSDKNIDGNTLPSPADVLASGGLNVKNRSQQKP